MAARMPDRRLLENGDPVRWGTGDGVQLTGDRFTSERQRFGNDRRPRTTPQSTGGHAGMSNSDSRLHR